MTKEKTCKTCRKTFASGGCMIRDDLQKRCLANNLSFWSSEDPNLESEYHKSKRLKSYYKATY